MNPAYLKVINICQGEKPKELIDLLVKEQSDIVNYINVSNFPIFESLYSESLLATLSLGVEVGGVKPSAELIEKCENKAYLVVRENAKNIIDIISSPI